MVLAGKEKFVKFFQNLDPLAAATLEQVDEKEYLGNPDIKHLPLQMVWRAPELVTHLVGAELMPEHAHRQAQHEIEIFKKDALEIANENLSVKEVAQKLTGRQVPVNLDRR
jgi:glutamine synthetase